MRKNVATALMLCVSLFVFAGSAFAQTGTGGVGGVVTDASKALVPGVTVTLTNTETGVVSTQVTNESGSYQFTGIPFGERYSVSASLPGFRTSVQNNVVVGVGAQVRVNITLEVGAIDSQVEVTVAGDQLLRESSASVGDVLPAQRALDLPLVGNDVLDLVKILPGYRMSQFSTPGFGVYDTFAGQTLDTVNVTRDGMSVNSGRYSAETYGLMSTTNINPELVGEIRLILAPVDAELGRGNSQIQIQTRSGTNRYTGSAVWNIQNSALNANSWANNNDTVNGVWTPTQPDWRNAHNITATYGGPIIRNKTFFFVAWDQQISNTRALQTNTVYSDSARQGIFRYWEYWNPQNATDSNEPTSYPVTGNNPGRKSVDDSGRPVIPSALPSGAAYTGQLKCFSMFGNMKLDLNNPGNLVPFTNSDCQFTASDGATTVGQFVSNPTPWDPLRTIPDATGYIAKVLGKMPSANYFRTGDGLNTAGYRWVRGAKGEGGPNAVVGISNFINRKQINIKIDQNFGSKHRVSGNWSYQKDESGDFLPPWPGGITGDATRTPQVLTISGTSTLSSSMLNEARFGLRRDHTGEFIPYEASDAAAREAAQEWYCGTAGAVCFTSLNPENGKMYPAQFNPAGVGNGFVNTNAQSLGNITSAYEFADTFSWTKGRHAFKFGATVRLTYSDGYNSIGGGSVLSTVTGGAPAGEGSVLASAPNAGTDPSSPIFGPLSNFVQTSRTNAASLLYFQTAAISTSNIGRWIDDASDVDLAHWEDITTRDHRVRDQVATEWSAFWKDDWKITRDLTLNLGVRYDWYGSPYIGSGFTTAPVGLGSGLFGNALPTSGGDFDSWLHPGNIYLTGYGNMGLTPSTALVCTPGQQQNPYLPVSTCDPDRLTTIQFIGPNTPNPNIQAIPSDNNNFAPAVGFSWQLPWFGAGKTTIRGGYSIQYGGAGRNGPGTDTLLAGAPGASNSATFSLDDPTLLNPSITYGDIFDGTNGAGPARALVLSDLPNIVPIRAGADPGAALPIYSSALDFTAYSPTFKTPYTQNLTLSVTRSLSRNMTLDLRYVGTFGRQLSGNIAVNEFSVYDNAELVEALTQTRAGQNSPLLDEMFAGMILTGGTPVGGVTTVGGLRWGPIGTCVTQLASVVNPAEGQEGCGPSQIMQHASTQLRRSTLANYADNLADGNFVDVVDELSQAAGFTNAIPPPTGMTGVNNVNVRNGCNRIANGLYNPNNPWTPTNSAATANIPTRCFPENYFRANPQADDITYVANLSHNNYHSVQTQFSLRPVSGISFQSTYTWGKLLTDRYNTYTDPRNRSADYSLDYASIAHEFRMNGTFELPFGPNRLLFGNSSGWVARVLERWSMSLIYNVGSGAPRDSYLTEAKLYAGGGGNQPQQLPDIVGPWVDPRTDYKWNGISATTGANTTGTIYGFPSPYVSYTDPQCTNPAVNGTDFTGFTMQCDLRGMAAIATQGTPGAILMADGVTWAIPMLQNPMPGERGTQGLRRLRLPGRWSLDGNLAKTFRITESKSVQLRFDANNILNHSNPGEPSFDVEALTTPFGQVNGRQGAPRSFQAQVRVAF